MRCLAYILLICVFVLQSCSQNCKDYTKNLGTIHLSQYDKGIFFNTYSLNQSIKFIRNKKDTITLQAADAYFREKQVKLSGWESIECGAASKYDLENYGIQLSSPLKDTSFYFYTQTIYLKSSDRFQTLEPSDTLSILYFGLNVTGFVRGAPGEIEIDTDKLQTDSLLIDNFLLNGKYYNNVYYYKNPNSYWKIKEIYFHPTFGVLKFSLYKPKSFTEVGDEYEILP